MKVFELKFLVEGYWQVVTPEGVNALELRNRFKGESLNYDAIDDKYMLYVHKVKGLRDPEIYNLYTAAIFKSTLVEKVKDEFSQFGQFIRIPVDGGNMYVYNVCNILDCLDIVKSVGQEVLGKHLVSLENGVFKSSMISKETIFSVPQFPGLRVFFTERYRDMLEGVKGIKFKEHSVE